MPRWNPQSLIGKRDARDEGYTLVELLVVLAILGLLVAIATPQVLKYLDSSKLSAAHTEVESLASAVDLYRLDVGRYPTAQESLEALVAAPPNVTAWNGPYVKKRASLIDPWGHPYKYRQPGQHGEFDIYSDGPDGGSEASGDKTVIGNW
jgi:general secretion pathway protein G